MMFLHQSVCPRCCRETTHPPRTLKYLFDILYIIYLSNVGYQVTYSSIPKGITTIVSLKGIVSRDFGGLQMIVMDRAWVPGITRTGSRFSIYYKAGRIIKHEATILLSVTVQKKRNPLKT